MENCLLSCQGACILYNFDVISLYINSYLSLTVLFYRHYQAITCLSFSFDNSYIASSGEDGIVSVWDLSDVWDIETSEQNGEYLIHCLRKSANTMLLPC